MKSMQRKFGGLVQKKSADHTDVGTVLAEFKSMDEGLERLVRDLKAWRDSWDDILKLQYDASEAFATLYKPIEPTNDPEMRRQPGATPQMYMSKCLALQKAYSDMKHDLQQEIGMINTRLVNPAEEAKQVLKPLKKTIKHRENMKLDYERYKSRVDHVQKKDGRSAKDEIALAKHESDLAQAQIDYETADDQVRETFPPITAAVMSLMPHLLASQVMIQTTLVGQLYTVLDEYTRKHGMPNPAPNNSEIITTWEQEFTSFRQELESEINSIAKGKAVNMPMTLPEKEGGTITGLGLRNKVMSRKASLQSQVPQSSSMGSSFMGGRQNTIEMPPPDYEEPAPPKPPRPGAMQSQSIPMGSKPRIPSFSNPQTPNNAPYDQKPTAMIPGYGKVTSPWSGQSPFDGGTPPSRYATPLNGASSPVFSAATNAGNDYFHQRRTSAASSLASSAAGIAGKKKPPPVPVKRIASGMQAHFVTALYDFEGQNEGDLAFREGDKIKVTRKTNSTDDWWEGELRGAAGSFPANYVQV